MKDNKTENINFRLTEDLLAFVCAVAFTYGMSKSNAVRYLLNLGIESENFKQAKLKEVDDK